MIDLTVLQHELTKYDNNRGFFEKDCEFITNLKEIAKKQIINDDDQLVILKNLIALAKTSKTLNSKACDTLVSNLRSNIGLDQYTFCRILVENNLLTTNNLKLLDFSYLLKSILRFAKATSATQNSLDQDSLDLLLLSVRKEEFSYKESRTKFLTDFIIELKKHNLYDAKICTELYQATLANEEANLRINELKQYKLCLMPENRVLEKGAIYLEIYSLKGQCQFEYSYLDSFDNPIVINAPLWILDGRLRYLRTEPLTSDKLNPLFNKIISSKIDHEFLLMRQALSKSLIEIALEKISTDFKVEKLLKANSDNSFHQLHLLYNPTVQCLKIIEFIHKARLINSTTIDSLFHAYISEVLLIIVSAYYDAGLLNETNFKKLTSLSSTQVSSLQKLISALAHNKLLTQTVLDAVLPGYRFIKNKNFNLVKNTNSTNKIQFHERVNDEPNLTVESMDTDCLYFYIDISTNMQCFAVKNDNNEIKKIEVNFSTNSSDYYRDYNFTVSKSGYPLLDLHPDHSEIFTLINIQDWVFRPDLLAKVIANSKINEVNNYFKYLSQATFLDLDLSNRLIDQIINAKNEPFSALQVIHQMPWKSFLNKESLTLVLDTEPKRYGKMWYCLLDLNKKSLLTIENLKDSLCFDNPIDPVGENLINAMELLTKEKLLNETNRALIKYSKYPLVLADSLIILTKHGLCSSANATILASGFEPHYWESLEVLVNSNLLSQANFDKVFNSGKIKIINFSLFGERVKITQNTIDLLANSNEPRKIVLVLRSLHYNNLWTEQNQRTYLTNANKEELSLFLYHLALTGFILNQTDLDNIFLHAASLGRVAELIIQLPRHLIDNNLLNRLFIICSSNIDIDTKERLMNNHIQQLLNHRPFNYGQNNQYQGLNSAQSTHTASVHRSVSESAKRLKSNYSQIVDLKGQDLIIEEIKAYIAKLPGEKFELTNKNSAAKRAMDSLVKIFWQFQDPSSQLSNLEILILVWEALHDENRRDKNCSLEQAKIYFINGLYELIRGYNLDELANDDGKEDKVICCPGGFNKIVECLYTIHPDVTIEHITRELAGIKLKTSATNCIINSFKLSELSTDDLKDLKSELENPDSQLIEKNYESVKSEIHDSLLEFKTLFKTDDEYNGFIDAGVWGIDQQKIDQAIEVKLIREKINTAILGKSIITNAMELPKNNDHSYLGWMNNHALGTRGINRFSHWFHGESGIKRARELLEVANNPKSSSSEILKKLQSTFEESSQHTHSLSRYLVAQFDQRDFREFERLTDDQFQAIKSDYRF